MTSEATGAADTSVVSTTACRDCAHGPHYPVTCQVVVLSYSTTTTVLGTMEVWRACGCNGVGPRL